MLLPEDSPAKTLASQEKAQGLPENEADFGSNISASSKKRSRATSSSKTCQPFALADWKKFSGHSLRSGMMRNGIVSPLPPLAHLTKGIESGLWPTPRASDTSAENPASKQARNERLRAAGHPKGCGSPSLATRVQYGVMFPTPQAQNSKGIAAENCTNKNGTWPQPGQKIYDKRTGKQVQTSLDQMIKLWPTPTANEDACGTVNGKMQKMLGNHPDVRNSGIGTLNPMWVEWLMGYPLGHTDLGVLETALFLKSRRSSAKR